MKTQEIKKKKPNMTSKSNKQRWDGFEKNGIGFCSCVNFASPIFSFLRIWDGQ